MKTTLLQFQGVQRLHPSDLLLTQEDQDALLKNGWLSDKHMYAAARMLKSQFLEIKGFQSTLSGRYVSVHSSPACQFHHYSSHWWVSRLTDGTVTLCDSMQSELPEPLCIQLQQVYGNLTSTIKVLLVQPQKGGADCAVFSTA